jgi:hypothetical protein
MFLDVKRAFWFYVHYAMFQGVNGIFLLHVPMFEDENEIPWFQIQCVLKSKNMQIFNLNNTIFYLFMDERPLVLPCLKELLR